MRFAPKTEDDNISASAPINMPINSPHTGPFLRPEKIAKSARKLMLIDATLCKSPNIIIQINNIYIQRTRSSLCSLRYFLTNGLAERSSALMCYFIVRPIISSDHHDLFQLPDINLGFYNRIYIKAAGIRLDRNNFPYQYAFFKKAVQP